MELEGLNRFDRIVAILIQLQSKRVVKAQELAERFQVSLRTIYRDIRSLETAGVPIIGEAGVGYSIMDGYRLPPVMFSREEAGSFVAAEKLMQKFTDKTLKAYYQSAMYKIKSVMRGTEKDWVDALESQVFIFPSEDLFNTDVPDALEILFGSIAEKKQVLLNYQSFHAEKSIKRTIEPIGLFHENNHWYVIGYCHLRKDYRQFRTDRIKRIKRTTDNFTREHKTVDEIRSGEQATEQTKVVILVDKDVIKYIERGRKYYGFVGEEEDGDQMNMTFMTCELEFLARWYLMFGDCAQIVEPESLKERVRELTTKIQQRLD